MRQIEMSNVQKRWLTGHCVRFIRIDRYQWNLIERVRTRFNQLILRRSVGLIECRGVWELPLHRFLLLFLPEDAITTWLNDTYLVIDLFSELAVRDYCLFPNPNLCKVSIIGFAVQSPTVDLSGIHLNPIGPTIKSTLLCKTSCVRRRRKINQRVTVPIRQGTNQESSSVLI